MFGRMVLNERTMISMLLFYKVLRMPYLHVRLGLSLLAFTQQSHKTQAKVATAATTLKLAVVMTEVLTDLAA